MKKTKFNLGPQSLDSPSSSPTSPITTSKVKKTTPIYKRIQNVSPTAEDPIAKELENGSYDSDGDPSEHGTTIGIPRAQLLIEYNSALETRERNIRNLADCIEKMMKT